jgi:hypothetical protein
MNTNSIVEILNEENLVILDDFICEMECMKILKELRFSYWHQSSVVKYIGDESSAAYLSDMRRSQTSGQVWFSEELNQHISLIEKRLATLLETTTDHFEEWQATRYGLNDKFDFHVDCGNWANSKAGERKRTFLLYLSTPVEGGETRFRALNKTIAAQAGRIVIWNNLLPSGKCNFAMIHAGLPVLQGTKTILVSWERERPLRIL